MRKGVNQTLFLTGIRRAVVQGPGDGGQQSPDDRRELGTRGIMQLMPSTFSEIRSKHPEITGRWDRPEWNIAAGIAYSRQLWDAWANDAVIEHAASSCRRVTTPVA
jgi:soluble lytic murein transglycosylase-like protein